MGAQHRENKSPDVEQWMWLEQCITIYVCMQGNQNPRVKNLLF